MLMQRVLACGFVAAILVSGCATPHPSQREPYMLAMRYDVEPRLVDVASGDVLTTVRRDFGVIHDLGFESVLLWHVEDVDRTAIMRIAQDEGLTVCVGDQTIEAYIDRGIIPGQFLSVRSMTRGIPSYVTDGVGFAAILVDPGSTLQSAGRASAVVTELRRWGMPWVVAGSRGMAGDIGGLATIASSEFVAGDEPAEARSAISLMLAQFHEHLQQGRNTGLLVDRFYRPPDQPQAVWHADGGLDPAQAAGIAAIVVRARQWGPRLSGLPVEPMPGAQTSDGNVRVSLMSDAKRCYVLVSSTDIAVAGGAVWFPETVADRGVDRAVEIPPVPSGGPGRVFRPRDGRVMLDVDLRFDHATLFEIVFRRNQPVSRVVESSQPVH